MEANLNGFDEEPPVRPVLLTVLCILTFIGSGWQIASNVWSYSMAPQTVRIFSSSHVKAPNDSTLQKDSVYRSGRKTKFRVGETIFLSVSKIMTVDNIRKSAAGNIASALLTLIGAVLMWKLRRIGFFIYMLGVVIGLILPFYIYGNNLLAIGISSFTSFFGLVFIALYALNIKNLR